PPGPGRRAGPGAPPHHARGRPDRPPAERPPGPRAVAPIAGAGAPPPRPAPAREVPGEARLADPLAGPPGLPGPGGQPGHRSLRAAGPAGLWRYGRRLQGPARPPAPAGRPAAHRGRPAAG